MHGWVGYHALDIALQTPLPYPLRKAQPCPTALTCRRAAMSMPLSQLLRDSSACQRSLAAVRKQDCSQGPAPDANVSRSASHSSNAACRAQRALHTGNSIDTKAAF